MRIHIVTALLGISTMAACSSSLCDESWAPERESLIRSNICNQDNLDAIESNLGDMTLLAVDGTSIVIDADTGQIVRVPGNVTSPQDSRAAVVNLNAAGAEELRPATAVPGALDIAEGIGFAVVSHADGPDEAVLVANSMKIGATYVRVIGSRPLTLVSSVVAVEGVVDVSAGCPDNPDSMICGGPGAGDGAIYDANVENVAGGCGPGGNGVGGQGEDTGGGGGGYGEAGGDGGYTEVSATTETRYGGPGGTIAACPGALLARFEGGSGGGYGEGGDGGAGGGGGGAFRVLASSEIRMGPENAPPSWRAGVWASGGGGESAFSPTAGSGGGGGGSGGAILLEAPHITLDNAILAANGGSGGSGGLSGDAPEDGDYGSFSATPTPGGGLEIYAGGAGGALDSPAQPGASSDLPDPQQIDGTGGGGGGAGIIRINTRPEGLVQTEAIISPAPGQGDL